MYSLTSMDVSFLLFIVAILLLSLNHTEAQIGVCYGRTNGSNLPCSAEQVVQLYEQYKIGSMRLYDPDQATLKALQGTNIKLMLGVSNQDIVNIGCHQSTADKWVRTNVAPYASSIKYIAVGNEIKPGSQEATYMVPAMQNILNALKSCNLTQIIVSTAIESGLLQNTFPPSSSTFKNLTYITPIIKFLLTNDWPLLANIQPYIAYKNNPKDISLDFVLFTSCGPKINDTGTHKLYQNLFDALYDSVYVAIKKVVDSINDHQYNLNDDVYNMKQRSKKQFKKPIPSESGTPSHKGFHKGKYKILEHNKDLKFTTRKESTTTTTATTRKGSKNCDCVQQCGYPKSGDLGTVENARIFYTNMIKHVKKGTPLTQGQELEVFLFEMFDENMKTGDESEKHYGLFTPDGHPKYGITNFSV